MVNVIKLSFLSCEIVLYLSNDTDYVTVIRVFDICSRFVNTLFVFKILVVYYYPFVFNDFKVD